MQIKITRAVGLINVNHHIRDFWRLEMCITGIIFWSYATTNYWAKKEEVCYNTTTNCAYPMKPKFFAV